jgi:hypothetical protein
VETGRIAYEAYHQAKYEKDHAHAWIWWADLDEDQQDYWRQAAHAVMQEGWARAQPSSSGNRL